MSQNRTMPTTYFDVLARARDQLLSARRGEKAAIVDRLAQELGITRQHAYRRLGGIGHAAGRKGRSDAGKTRISEPELHAIALAMTSTFPSCGKFMPLEEAIRQCRQSGSLTCDLHRTQIYRQLRLRGLMPKRASNFAA